MLEGRNPKKARRSATSNSAADRAADTVRASRRQRETSLLEANRQLAQKQWRQPIIAIDPGDKHVGWATFVDGSCTLGIECEPDQALDALHHAITTGIVTTIVVENWRLYGDKAAKQVGSEMLTSQMIGAVKWQVRQHNATVASIAAARKVDEPDWDGSMDDLGLRYVDLVLQPADIKEPTRAVLRRLKIAPTAPKTPGDHCRDAELHGWHYILLGQGLIRGGR